MMLLRGGKGRVLFILSVNFSSQMGEEDEFGRCMGWYSLVGWTMKQGWMIFIFYFVFDNDDVKGK
jgi:hypothetical protein